MKKGFTHFVAIFVVLFIVLISGVLGYELVLQPYRVKSSQNTIFASDTQVWAEKVSFRFNEPSVGDVVLFQFPQDDILLTEWIGVVLEKIDQDYYLIATKDENFAWKVARKDIFGRVFYPEFDIDEARIKSSVELVYSNSSLEPIQVKPAATLELLNYDGTTLPPRPTPFTQKYKEQISYKRYLFDKNTNFYNDKPYPKELVQLTDTEVKLLYCSPPFEYDGDYFAMDKEWEKIGILDNPRIISFLDIKNKSLLSDKKRVELVTYCQDNTEKKYVHYEIHGGGGGSENAAFFGVLSDNNTLTKEIQVVNDGSPYFGCATPLALRTTNQFYWACGGGDGGYGSRSIYKLDFNLNEATRVVKCESKVVEELNNEYKEVTNCTN